MNFDIEALIRAVIIGISTGFIVNGILKLLFTDKKKWVRWKSSMTLILIGFGLLISIGIYYKWPSLVEVPLLDNRSEDEATMLLEKRSLLSHVLPRYSDQVENGRVIPYSQNPPAGQMIKKKKIVEFAVAINKPPDPIPPPPDSIIRIMIINPRSQASFNLIKGGNGIYTGEVYGTSSGLKKNREFLLLWVRPTDPPSDKSGWYLQRYPNGISLFKEDGSWIGNARLGNMEWPPKDGNIIDIAVSVVDKTTYDSLMARGGEAMSQEPIGNIVDQSIHVVIKIKL